MPERTCIATGEAQPPAGLLRFVAGPDGAVVPDLKGRLPGRGAWVTATHEHVARAAARNLFARKLKAPVRADAGLADSVDALMVDAALAALSMARKAGALVTGASKVDGAVRANEALAVLHATDAAADGIRKIDGAVRAVGHMGGEPVPRVQLFSTDELARALGLANPVHLALTVAGRGTGAAEAALARLDALKRYRGEPDPPPDRPGNEGRGDEGGDA